MFFLQTKDGDRFLTGKDSDDSKEFERIIEDKLGKEAAELYDSLITEHEDNAQELLNKFKNRYNECIKNFDALMNERPVNTVKLEEVLCELQGLYLDFLR
jgi:hypothetical protein